MEADPKNANNLVTYGDCLTDVRGNHGEAEKYYKRAIEADPNNANNLGNYANFTTNERGNQNEAKYYY